MFLLVRSIDFALKAVSIDVTRSIDNVRFAHLAHFLHYCADRGFKKIDIRYPSQLPTALFLMLQDLQRTEDLPRITLSAQSNGSCAGTDDSRRIACDGTFVDPGKSAEFRFTHRGLENALDDLTLALLIVGFSIPLGETTLAYLRLCLYELGANTVEHGRFDGVDPEIRVKLVVGADRVEIEYSDNAGAFSTSRTAPVDIADKIKRRSKRGLGLTLLNRLPDNLAYARERGWNRTTIIIGRKESLPFDLNRRMKMNDLSITVGRTGSPDVVVLKLSGSINSQTVPQLDATFGEHTSAGRYTIVLDLSGTDFISSSGVGLLIGTASVLRDKNGDLVLMNLPKLVNDIFDVLNIKMHFRIIKDLSELKVGAKA